MIGFDRFVVWLCGKLHHYQVEAQKRVRRRQVEENLVDALFLYRRRGKWDDRDWAAVQTYLLEVVGPTLPHSLREGTLEAILELKEDELYRWLRSQCKRHSTL